MTTDARADDAPDQLTDTDMVSVGWGGATLTFPAFLLPCVMASIAAADDAGGAS